MIRANFSAYGTYVTDSVYQWDINRTLVVNGLNLEQAPEIHFYNANMERAVVRQATLDNGVATVTIPNALLQEALTIKADVCIYEDNVRKTIENIEIPVKAKARPLDYVFEDDGGEIYSYNTLLNEVRASLKDATDKYNTLIDEMGRIKDEYVGLPDRFTALENRTPNFYQGTYTGVDETGIAEVTLTLTFNPKILIIQSDYRSMIAIKRDNSNYHPTELFPIASTGAFAFITNNVKFTDNVVRWKPKDTSSSFTHDTFNTKGVTYSYIAIG